MVKNTTMRVALVVALAGFAMVAGSGCSNTNNNNGPTTLQQQKSALIGEPAPPDALKQYVAQHPKLQVNVPTTPVAHP
jgi:hypothetical protein